MLKALTICLLCVLTLSACSNAGELRRRDLRDATTSVGAKSSGRIGEIARNARILRGDADESASPTMRWQAAQNLGTLKSTTHIDLLLLRGISSTADRSQNVRRECILALGHMPIKQALSARRQSIVKKLYERLIATNEESGRALLAERNSEVRIALVATILTLGLPSFGRDQPMPKVGYQDVASFLYLIAVHHDKAFTPGDERVNDLIVERALGGLEVIVGTPKSEWQPQRRMLDRTSYIEWWNKQIAAMPRLDQYQQASESHPHGT